MSFPVLAHCCPLCGLQFDEGVAKCGSCPLHEGCQTTCCPRCGYTFADRSATVEALRRVGRSLGRWLRPGPPRREERA